MPPRDGLLTSKRDPKALIITLHSPHHVRPSPHVVDCPYVSKVGSIPRVAVGILFLLATVAWPNGRQREMLGVLADPVDRVLQEAPLIDGHNDFAIWIRAFHKNHLHNLTDSSPIDGQVDFPRLREGRLRGQFWSVYMPCPKINSRHPEESYYEIIHDTIQQIDLIHSLIAAFPKYLRYAANAQEVWSNFESSDTISSLIGAEGLHQIGASASVLRMYHRLGMRYITLTHDCHNRYADSASPAVPLHHGISSAGALMLREMNRIGIVIDLSHTSAETMRMALGLSKAPIMFSHSSSFALCPHPRNVPDDVLLAVRANGGIVMVTFYPEYVNCKDPGKASMGEVADHIEYIGRLIGYEHVGIGSDFDGMTRGPRGLEDVSQYPNLIRELVRRSLSERELVGVVGGNILRVLRGVELVALQMYDVQPLEDDVKSLFG